MDWKCSYDLKKLKNSFRLANTQLKYPFFDTILSHSTWEKELLYFLSLNCLLSCNSRCSDMLEPNKDFLTWRMPVSLNTLVCPDKDLHRPWFCFLFFFLSFWLCTTSLVGGKAGMRERLHSHKHHQNHDQEQQVCAWLHICGGGNVCLGSHEYFWLGTVGDSPHWINSQDIRMLYGQALL